MRYDFKNNQDIEDWKKYKSLERRLPKTRNIKELSGNFHYNLCQAYLRVLAISSKNKMIPKDF